MQKILQSSIRWSQL